MKISGEPNIKKLNKKDSVKTNSCFSNAILNRNYSLLILMVVMVVIPLITSSDYFLRVVALVWIMSIAAVGLQVIMGMAGQISLGHAGFFGIGAYAVAVLPVKFGFSVWLATPVGILASGLIAYLVGKPILRLRGHYLAIATLGFSLLVGLVITGEALVTGGPDGMSVQPLNIAGHDLVSVISWYWISCFILILVMWMTLMLRDSPSGRALRAVLGSEVAASSMGVNVATRKLQAFIIAAVFAAIGGCVLALMNGFVTPDIAGFMMSVEFVAMVVLGGLASPFGAIVGAALLTLLPQFLASFFEYQEAVIGLVIMATMVFLRRGIIPTIAYWISGKE